MPETNTDLWELEWHWNGDAKKVKTQTFHRVTDAQMWFYKAETLSYSSILTILPEPAAVDAGSSASICDLPAPAADDAGASAWIGGLPVPPADDAGSSASIRDWALA